MGRGPFVKMDNKLQDIHYVNFRNNEQKVIRAVIIEKIAFENGWIVITFRRPENELSNFHVFFTDYGKI